MLLRCSFDAWKASWDACRVSAQQHRAIGKLKADKAHVESARRRVSLSDQCRNEVQQILLEMTSIPQRRCRAHPSYSCVALKVRVRLIEAQQRTEISRFLGHLRRPADFGGPDPRCLGHRVEPIRGAVAARSVHKAVA